MRSLETASQAGELQPFAGDTNIFIYPGYEFRSVDAMITNFHLPGSTLVMLVSAFAGRDLILEAYQDEVLEAVARPHWEGVRVVNRKDEVLIVFKRKVLTTFDLQLEFRKSRDGV